MKKANKIGLVFISLILIFLVGCLETDQTTFPESIDYRSEVKLVNLAADAGNVNFEIYSLPDIKSRTKENEGSVNLGGEWPSDRYQNVPSGRKQILISYGSTTDTLNLSFKTERKMKIYLVKSGKKISQIIRDERYIWQTKGSTEGAHLFKTDTARVSITNASAVEVTGIRYITGGDTVKIDKSALASLASKSIELTAPKDYVFLFDTKVGDVEKTLEMPYNFKAQTRYSFVLYGKTQDNLVGKVFIDD